MADGSNEVEDECLENIKYFVKRVDLGLTILSNFIEWRNQSGIVSSEEYDRLCKFLESKTSEGEYEIGTKKTRDIRRCCERVFKDFESKRTTMCIRVNEASYGLEGVVESFILMEDKKKIKVIGNKVLEIIKNAQAKLDANLNKLKESYML